MSQLPKHKSVTGGRAQNTLHKAEEGTLASKVVTILSGMGHVPLVASGVGEVAVEALKGHDQCAFSALNSESNSYRTTLLLGHTGDDVVASYADETEQFVGKF